MTDIYLQDSLERDKKKFTPVNPPEVGVYACGPTVYDYASIGSFRTYITSDVLIRFLKYAGYDVTYVMNITDVGHLTGDNLGDADTGEDRMEKSARKKGESAWDIAERYTKAFIKDFERLNLVRPDKLPKATDHIKEQIELVKTLEEKGFTYKISDGIYFDTKAYEKKTGDKYGEVSTLDEIKEGARVEKNPEKKNPRDFALWKFSPKDKERQMEWESPWGKGFPGWHAECSAMSMKYLGESFDIHLGGEDLRQTHHPNEIAQSQGATGKKFVNFWLHGAFLQVDGEKMGKSKGNFYTVQDIVQKGYDPLALRYLYLTAHYRDPLNFTWDALDSAQNALDNLRNKLLSAKSEKARTTLSQEKREKVDQYRRSFIEALYDDLNTPKAIASMWEMVKSNIPGLDKYDLLLTFDEILGLKLGEVKQVKLNIPKKVEELLEKREELRKDEKFDEADDVRRKIEEEGYIIKDTREGSKLDKK